MKESPSTSRGITESFIGKWNKEEKTVSSNIAIDHFCMFHSGGAFLTGPENEMGGVAIHFCISFNMQKHSWIWYQINVHILANRK